MAGVRILEYVDAQGGNPFRAWFDGLNAQAAAKITAALYRLGEGNFSNVKGVGAGVFERRVDYGPGYRIYFGNDGESIVVLLGGGTKKRQQESIRLARMRWDDYRARKSRH